LPNNIYHPDHDLIYNPVYLAPHLWIMYLWYRWTLLELYKKYTK